MQRRRESDSTKCADHENLLKRCVIVFALETKGHDQRWENFNFPRNAKRVCVVDCIDICSNLVSHRVYHGVIASVQANFSEFFH
jgi:hypothetical protein